MGGFSTIMTISPSDVWNYPTRTLTQSKFPFWSAIITQQASSVVVSANYASVNISIQPPAGETWYVSISECADSGYIDIMYYRDYDGTTARIHTLKAWGYLFGIFEVTRILTNSLYAYLYARNSDTSYAHTFYYAYSGFKLSQPLWTAQRNITTAKMKLPTDVPLPDPIKPLDKYKALMPSAEDPTKYELVVILEEDTPIAVDPNTNFPVERKTVYVKADKLAELVINMRKGTVDYVNAGYEPYLKKWKAEGIDLGII